MNYREIDNFIYKYGMLDILEVFKSDQGISNKAKKTTNKLIDTIKNNCICCDCINK